MSRSRSCVGAAALVLALLAPVSAPGPGGPRPAAAQARDPRSQAAEQILDEGFGLARRGEHQAAIERYRLGLRIAPDNGLGHYYLAESLKATGQRAEALDHYRKAATLIPTTKEGIIAAAIVGQEEEAQRRQQTAALLEAQRQRFEAFRSGVNQTWCAVSARWGINRDIYIRPRLSASGDAMVIEHWDVSNRRTIWPTRRTMTSVETYTEGKVIRGAFVGHRDGVPKAVMLEGQELKICDRDDGGEVSSCRTYVACEP